MSYNAIGEQLKSARESRGLTIDNVADETNMAKRYIVAMEEENFSIFPGEPYVIGFLRNYAEYLGLDQRLILNSFKNIGIQEQPAPIQELLIPQKKNKWPIIIVASVIIIASATFLFFRLGKIKQNNNTTITVATEPAQYKMEAAVLEKRFYEGDSVIIPYSNDLYKLKIIKIDDMIAIENPIGVTRFMLGEEGSIDLDKDNQPELKVFIVDFQKNDSSRGAMIRFSASGALAQLWPSGASTDSNIASDPNATITASATNAPSTDVPVVTEKIAIQETIVFSGKRSPFPFVLNVTFRNYSMFRSELDRKDRDEKYYQKGEQITITANNQAKIWTSNASASKLTIQASGGQSSDVDLGLPGEVAVKLIKWVQSDDGTWSLCVYNVN